MESRETLPKLAALSSDDAVLSAGRSPAPVDASSQTFPTGSRTTSSVVEDSCPICTEPLTEI